MEFLTKIVDQMPEANRRTFENLCQIYRKKADAKGVAVSADSGDRKATFDETLVTQLRQKDAGFDKGLRTFMAAYEKHKSMMSSIKGKVAPAVVAAAVSAAEAPAPEKKASGKKAAATPSKDSDSQDESSKE